MSNHIDDIKIKKNSDFYIDFLERSIAEERIVYYKYSDFKNVQQIGKGSFGNVVRVNCKSTDCFFALKSFNNDEITLKEVINEVRYL